MISEAFKTAIWEYRRQGGRLYKLAFMYGMSPSVLTASLIGTRRVEGDERLIKMGEALGVKREDVFALDEAPGP